MLTWTSPAEYWCRISPFLLFRVRTMPGSYCLLYLWSAETFILCLTWQSPSDYGLIFCLSAVVSGIGKTINVILTSAGAQLQTITSRSYAVHARLQAITSRSYAVHAWLQAITSRSYAVHARLQPLTDNSKCIARTGITSAPYRSGILKDSRQQALTHIR